MALIARAATVDELRSSREAYRRGFGAQILHDSFHARAGWTRSYVLLDGEVVIGHASIVEAGPWSGRPTLFEFHVPEPHRARAFELFETVLAAARPVGMRAQTNDALAAVLLHAFARDVVCEKLVFRAGAASDVRAVGRSRAVTAADRAALTAAGLDEAASLGIELDGRLIAAGGVLDHYNPPYGDVYFAVAEPWRRRGVGAFLAQELARAAREQGLSPTARCDPSNVGSRKALARAGFVPCAVLLEGALAP